MSESIIGSYGKLMNWILMMNIPLLSGQANRIHFQCRESRREYCPFTRILPYFSDVYNY